MIADPASNAGDRVSGNLSGVRSFRVRQFDTADFQSGVLSNWYLGLELRPANPDTFETIAKEWPTKCPLSLKEAHTPARTCITPAKFSTGWKKSLAALGTPLDKDKFKAHHRVVR
jgi:hypothetical protein